MARVITAPGIVRNVSKYLNSMRRVPFAIGKDDWTEVDSSTYTYEFVTAYVTTSSFDIGTFDNSVRSYAKGDISMEKKDGGGGMVFTTTKRPTGTVSGSIYIWDNNDNKVPVILEDTVIPIENGGTGATSIPGILSTLGLGSANDAQETLEFGDAVHKDVANNVTTTSEGYLLDARQGKVLKDSVDALNSNCARNRGNINSISSDTAILDYLNGTYQIAISGSTNGYLPEHYGTLIVNDSGESYKSFIFVSTTNQVFIRIGHKVNKTWYSSWQELALNSTLDNYMPSRKEAGSQPTTVDTLKNGLVYVSSTSQGAPVNYCVIMAFSVATYAFQMAFVANSTAAYLRGGSIGSSSITWSAWKQFST